jgi:hypothetical protein
MDVKKILMTLCLLAMFTIPVLATAPTGNVNVVCQNASSDLSGCLAPGDVPAAVSTTAIVLLMGVVGLATLLVLAWAFGWITKTLRTPKIG